MGKIKRFYRQRDSSFSIHFDGGSRDVCVSPPSKLIFHETDILISSDLNTYQARVASSWSDAVRHLCRNKSHCVSRHHLAQRRGDCGSVPWFLGPSVVVFWRAGLLGKETYERGFALFCSVPEKQEHHKYLGYR